MKQGEKYIITVNKISHKTRRYWAMIGDEVTIISVLDTHNVIVETKNKHRFTTLKTNLK